MIRRGLALALLALAVGRPPPAVAQARFTDDGGRVVAMPARIARVMPAGPPAAADLLMLAPEKLVGLPRALSPEQAAFLPPRAAALPGLGRLTARDNAANLAAVVKAAPDLIVDLGDVDAHYAALADRVQRRTGIPYVLIGGRLADAPATWRKLGALLGAKARAEALARYAEETLTLIRNGVAAIPPDRHPSVYIARGPRGLDTEAANSLGAEALDLVGARNVAAAGDPPSLEGLRASQPDVIIATDPAFYRSVWQDPAWRGLAALREKRLYLAPALPFGWIDEPPAANRLLGLRWLAKLLYPARFPEDIRAETRRFYVLFYRREPSDAQLEELLAGTAPPS